MPVSNEDIQYLLDLGLSEEDARNIFSSTIANPETTFYSTVYTPPPGSIDVGDMPSRDDIYGTDYGDGATTSTSPTTGGVGDFSDNVDTPIEEEYGEQVTYDTSGNPIPTGQGGQSGVPGIPVESMPGVGQYSEREVGFRNRSELPPAGNDVGSPPQNPVPSPDIGVPPPTTPPPQPTITAPGGTRGYGMGRDPSSPAPTGVGLQQQNPQTNDLPVSFGNTQRAVVYRAKGGLILKDPMPGYKGRGV